MNCTTCNIKGCKKLSPCIDNSIDYIDEYFKEETLNTIKNSLSLVDNGKAGTLNRLEEIVEYCKLQNYKKIGVAYCYSIEKEAVILNDYLKEKGFNLTMVSCTVDGISEKKINKDKQKDVISCNPIGQANILNKNNIDFAILMGLCLGHDILFQKHIKADFTTFVVKDRVLRHNPILALKEGKLPEDLFLEQMPSDFNMIKKDELNEKLKMPDYLKYSYIIDLRQKNEYLKNHIEGAKNCLLVELPSQYKKLIPDKNREIIIYCNGGIQSIYAVMFLSLKGYKNVKNLSGGYSITQINQIVTDYTD
ncbi:MAG: hypothetical protein A2086_10325 [Spirochaetes bacterium GWD1_27_9]|nr:MAG: hypothetical protein A2Z98_08350 [Spirochaetes bacterium GWB1_27_13]OHD23300.1 MAG: hypothetical protein A2Y34_11550 [Spirochaetes bacterium GWC1_27_15]OHD43193.1 MAG: hypothetical protein A2086_10325 [Spirochaetes bacterium GWD1_27_9]